MKLYYFPGSCALAPHIVLEWLGADFEAVRITKGDPDYLAINPLGVVPALDHDGRIHTQADAILHYLAELNPDASLGGHGTPAENYELNNWMAFLTGDLHPAFFPFFNSQRYTTDESDAALAAVKAAAANRVDHYYSFMETHLADHDFLVGDSRTIADAYAIPMLRWGRLLEKKLPEYPSLNAYLERFESDEPVRRALREQGLIR
jgi:glutathione S-transferase